jgi:hypothetical protein
LKKWDLIAIITAIQLWIFLIISNNVRSVAILLIRNLESVSVQMRAKIIDERETGSDLF